MNVWVTHLSQNNQAVINRFIAACRADERVVAAFLGGSYARDAADAHSDLDLYLITTDAAYDDFCTGREAFVRQLGEPLLLEDFDLPDFVFLILADGIEVELGFGREGHYKHIHSGPYRTLLDKKDLLAEAVFPKHEADPIEQVETLRRQVYWFWHDLSHFITALGRGQLWWAYGQLEVLRRCCVNLARLQHNFSDAEVGEDPYFKVEQHLPADWLSPLQATCCPLEPEAMHQAALMLLRFYQSVVPALTQQHEIPYPADLERVMVDRLK